MTITTRNRQSGVFLIGAGITITLLLTLLIPGIAPWSPKPADAAADIGATCTVSYGALDPADPTKVNPNKESPAAVGPTVAQRDEPGIKAELDERRNCGADGKFDTELVATQYARWSAEGLTSRKVEYANIDAFRAEVNANADTYAATLKELESLEDASAFSVEAVPAGMFSVYVTPNGDGEITTHVGTVSNPGSAAVFKHGNSVIQYRLDCGFQILFQVPPPGLPVCDYADCGPTPPPPPPCTINCTPVCPYNPALPLDSLDCLEPKKLENDVTPPAGEVPFSLGALQPEEPAATSSSPVPVQGATPAPTPETPAPTVPQAAPPSDPGTPITDPDG